MLNHSKSKAHYLEACRYLVGGVGSNARLTPGMEPICIERGKGSRIFDIDGNEYIDYFLGLGPLILGHCPPTVIEAVKQQIEKGSLFGSAAPGEETLARMVCECIPSCDMVSFTNSASEAVHMALRLARAFTGKTKTLKFEGCYHGWFDDVMVSVHPESLEAMGLEEAPRPVLEGPGQSRNVLDNIIVAPFNKPEELENIFHKYGHEIAALILEPLPVNNGVMPPNEGFLATVKELSQRHKSLLVFDETVTGFRMSLGGAQEYYGVFPDLTVFGKGIGGGYPIAGFGGKKEVMDLIAGGKVGRGGTYNSNSLCVAASIAVLKELSAEDGAKLRSMTSMGQKLMKGIERIFSEQAIPAQIVGPGPFFSVFFTNKTISTYRDTLGLDQGFFQQFWRDLHDRGVRMWSTVRGLWFLSTAHTTEDIDLTLEKISDTAGELKYRM